MELGYYSGCQGEYGDIADFVLFNSNISHLIGMGRMGLCLPKGCKQHHLDWFVEGQLKTVNGYLDYLADYYHHPKINSMFVREWSRVGMSLIKSDEYTQSWRERTWPGVIPITIIISLIVALAIVSNLIKFYKYKQAWFSRTKDPILNGDRVETDGNMGL